MQLGIGFGRDFLDFWMLKCPLNQGVRGFGSDPAFLKLLDDRVTSFD